MADYRVVTYGPTGGWIEVKSPDRVVIDELVLSRFVVPAGTSFPPTPSDNEIFWRTDSQELFKWEQSTATWRPAVTTDNVLQRYGLAYGDPTGFQSLGESDLSWDHSTATLTISPTGPSFTFYVGGNKFTRSAPESITISMPGHAYYSFAYDANGDLVNCTTPFLYDGNFCPIAVVTYDTTGGARSVMADHRGQYENSLITRKLGQVRENVQAIRGLDISDYVMNVDNDVSVQFSISSGVFTLLDIRHYVASIDPPSAPYEQALDKPAQLPIVYRLGSDWTWDAPTNWAYKLGPGSGRTAYNLNTAGVWSVEEPPSPSYVAYWIVLTNNTTNPVVSVMGQSHYPTLVEAKEGHTFNSLYLWDRFPATCFKVLYRIILRTETGYGGNRKCRIADVSDYRGILNSEHFPLHSDKQAFPVDHGALKNIVGQASHPAAAIAPDETKFQVLLGDADTDLQQALQTLDLHHHHAEMVVQDFVNLNGKSIYTVEAQMFPAYGALYFRDHHMGTWDTLYKYCYWQISPTSSGGTWTRPQRFATKAEFFTWLEQSVPTNPSEEYIDNAYIRAFELVDDRDPFPSMLRHRNSMLASMMGRKMWVKKRAPGYPKLYGVDWKFYTWYSSWANTLGLRLVNYITSTVPPTNNDDVVWYHRGSRTLWNWPKTGQTVYVAPNYRGAAWNMTTQAWVSPAPAGSYSIGAPFLLVEWGRSRSLSFIGFSNPYERNVALQSVACLVYPLTCGIGPDTYLSFLVLPYNCDNFITDYVDETTHEVVLAKQYKHSFSKNYLLVPSYSTNGYDTIWGIFQPGGGYSMSLIVQPRSSSGGAFYNKDSDTIPTELYIAKRDKSTGIRTPWRSVLKIHKRVPFATYRVDPSPRWHRI